MPKGNMSGDWMQQRQRGIQQKLRNAKRKWSNFVICTRAKSEWINLDAACGVAWGRRKATCDTCRRGGAKQHTPPLPNCSCNSSPNSNQTPPGATSSSRLLIYVKNRLCGNVFALNRKTLAKNNARITVAGSWDAQCPECSPGLLDSAGFDCKIYWTHFTALQPSLCSTHLHWQQNQKANW